MPRPDRSRLPCMRRSVRQPLSTTRLSVSTRRVTTTVSEGVTFTFAGLGVAPVSFTTDADGVGTANILDGISSVTQVTLSADDPARGYAYCSDQNSGAVLYDGIKFEGGAIPLFTVDSSQAIVCDWYIYTDEVAAG